MSGFRACVRASFASLADHLQRVCFICQGFQNGALLHDTLLKSNKNNPFLQGMQGGTDVSTAATTATTDALRPAAASTAASGSPGRSRDRNVFGPMPASAAVTLPLLKGLLRCVCVCVC